MIEEAERVSYRIGLTPSEFGQLTPIELRRMAEERIEYHQDLVALHLAPILSMFSDEPIDPQTLFDEPDNEKRVEDFEEKAEMFGLLEDETDAD